MTLYLRLCIALLILNYQLVDYIPCFSLGTCVFHEKSNSRDSFNFYSFPIPVSKLEYFNKNKH